MKITNNNLFGGAAITCLLIYLLIEPNSPISMSDTLFKYESSIFEPIFYVSFSLAIATALFFFTKKNFQAWLKYILSWFLPLTVLVVASGTDGAQFGWMPKTTLAQIMGALLVLITVVFIAIQTFRSTHLKHK